MIESEENTGVKQTRRVMKKRLQNNDAFVRDDTTKIRLVATLDNCDVRLSFESSSGETCEKVFAPHMPAFFRTFYMNTL